LILDPMVMDNGQMIDYDCLRKCFRRPGGYNPQNPVKFAVPSVFARDEISRLLMLTYDGPAQLPEFKDVLHAPPSLEEFNALVERRRQTRRALQVAITINEEPRREMYRTARLMPRNEEVFADEERRVGATPERFYRPVIARDQNAAHLMPQSLYSDTTIDLTLESDSSVDTTDEMPGPNPSIESTPVRRSNE
jgi:hypothetical protein